MTLVSIAACLLLAQPPAKAPPAPAQEPAAATRTPAFPADWQGVWKGVMTTHAPGGKPGLAFTMELRVKEIEPAKRWEWTIIYEGPQGRSERPYQLVAKDAAKGTYQIDEKNGIILEATLLGDTLASPFEVQGTTLLAEYRLRDGNIEVAIWSWPGEGTKTGPEGLEVKTWQAGSVQRGVLKRAAIP